MRLFAIVTIIALSIVPSNAAVSVKMKLINSSGAVSIYDSRVVSEKGFLSKRVYVVNEKEPKPKKFIWLFHGFKPGGDPYKQSPIYFINNWQIEQFCKKNGYVCIIPDMGTSLYPLREYNNTEKFSDMRFLKELYNEIIFSKFKDAPLVLIGVSTGVEGAIKFSTLVSNVESIACLSGTYDFYSIPRNSGEYRIHESQLGTDSASWFTENPLEILKKSVRLRLYLFCESKSIYREQAIQLMAQRFSNIDIVNHLDIGNGHSHNWGFWGNLKIVSTLHKHIAE